MSGSRFPPRIRGGLQQIIYNCLPAARQRSRRLCPPSLPSPWRSFPSLPLTVSGAARAWGSSEMKVLSARNGVLPPTPLPGLLQQIATNRVALNKREFIISLLQGSEMQTESLGQSQGVQ